MKVLKGTRLKSANILILGSVEVTPRGLPVVEIDAYVPLVYSVSGMAALVKESRN